LKMSWKSMVRYPLPKLLLLGSRCQSSSWIKEKNPCPKLSSTVIYCSVSAHFDLVFLCYHCIRNPFETGVFSAFLQAWPHLCFLSVCTLIQQAPPTHSTSCLARAASHHPVDKTLRLLLWLFYPVLSVVF
jgi:hypothetical protein